MEISIKPDIRQVTKYLNNVQKKQVPFATAQALTATAWDAKKEIDRQMPMKIDRPTPFTKRAIAVLKANKRTLFSRVFIRAAQEEYLKYQIEGGTRKPKGRAIAVPYYRGGNIKPNKYGNLPRKKINKLLSNKNTFIATIKGNHGVWQRRGNNRKETGYVRLLIGFERSVQYKPRFHFYKIGLNKAKAVFPNRFNAAMIRALRSAK